MGSNGSKRHFLAHLKLPVKSPFCIALQQPRALCPMLHFALLNIICWKILAGFSEAVLDERLHHMSKWHCNYAGFQRFVRLTVAPLKIVSSKPFHFLELGVLIVVAWLHCSIVMYSMLIFCIQVGVGAFARVLLQDFPSSTMIGIDHSPKAISISDVVLPRNRSKTLVADMAALPASLGMFDYILSPGSLCYLRSLSAVRSAIAGYMQILRPAGGFCASMLPVSWDERGSCSTYIPEDFWTHLPNFCLISSESMEKWPVSGGGRYSICGRKC